MGLLSVPLKTILPYHADLQNEAIPESYALCDGSTLVSAQQDINPGGTYTVPDLRNVFLLGADITKAASNAGNTSVGASGAPGPKGTGGAHSKTLVTAELPSHSHNGIVANAGAHTHAGSSTDSGGTHSHTANTTTAGAHTHNGSTTSITGAHTHSGSSVGLAGQHSHTVIDPGHVHTFKRQEVSLTSPGAMYLVNVRDDITHQETTNSAVTGVTIGINGDHVHTLTVASDGNHSHSLSITSDGSHTHPVSIDTGGSHTHTITLLSDGDHSHSFTGGNTGSGQSWDTRPQYYGVVYIMKVKT